VCVIEFTTLLIEMNRIDDKFYKNTQRQVDLKKLRGKICTRGVLVKCVFIFVSSISQALSLTRNILVLNP